MERLKKDMLKIIDNCQKAIDAAVMHEITDTLELKMTPIPGRNDFHMEYKRTKQRWYV